MARHARQDPTTRMSKRLAYVLRHDPASAGITLDADGWADVDLLVAGVPGLTRDLLERIVANDAKGRYTLAGERVRAAQGHSAGVADAMHRTPVEPPDVLFHGTTERVADVVLTDGLRPGSRSHVHLSADSATATAVGARRGRPVVLRVDAAAAHAAGVRFHLADNGVWLAEDGVAARFVARCAAPAYREGSTETDNDGGTRV